MEATVGNESISSEKKKRSKRFKKPTRLEVFAFLLISAAIIAFLWPFCTETIDGGHVGVYYSTFFGGTQTNKTYGEGIHFVLPWDKLISYDGRVQSNDYKISALAKGGLTVQVEMTAVFFINRDEAGLLHKTLGVDYREKMIDPAVLSSVRSVVGRLTQTELYDADLLQVQSDVLAQVSGIFQGQPLTIRSVLIRQISFPDAVSEAISEKFVAEQNVLEERYRVLQAVEEYKEAYVNAEATRFAQALITEGMSEAFLRYLGIEATLKLAESDNSKLVIIGDKDGLPLILNPDTLETSVTDTYPDGLSLDEYRVEEGELTRPEQFRQNYDRIMEMLEELTIITDELNSDFPYASLDIDTTIPQQGQVDTPKNNGGD
ncbi:MAG: prohibitin family protein [Oscillospiraceae bacterium]|jgi:regulator of protease activity HflC (stomatin/prohibitin superfamily)|nr:prohibitin family protein [Oscillospiraceae bacterium]